MNMVFPVADPVTPLAAAPAILAAASLLLPYLERGQRIDVATLRGAMETAFGASDATGVWDWKMAYEACEVATVLFLRKYGKALFRKAGSAAETLPLLTKIASLLPTHTRRSEEAQTYQQFSTPIPLGLIAATAGRIWVESKVDFSEPKNLLTVATALILGAGDLKLPIFGFELGGIGTATFGAIALYHLLNRKAA